MQASPAGLRSASAGVGSTKGGLQRQAARFIGLFKVTDPRTNTKGVNMDRIEWIGQHENQVWGIIAKIRAQYPKLYAEYTPHDDDRDVTGLFGPIRWVWHEGITDEEWFDATVKKLEELLLSEDM